MENKMCLYTFTSNDGMEFFDTNDELKKYVCDNKLEGYVTKFEYIGDIYNSIDVIKETHEDGSFRLITVADDFGYLYFDEVKSKKYNQIMWEYSQGCLRNIYKAFRDRGIIFTDDTYKKIDERNQKIMMNYKKKQLKRF